MPFGPPVISVLLSSRMRTISPEAERDNRQIVTRADAWTGKPNAEARCRQKPAPPAAGGSEARAVIVVQAAQR